MPGVKNHITCVLIFSVVIFGTVSCDNNKRPAKQIRPRNNAISVSTLVTTNSLMVKGDSLQLSIDNQLVVFPKKSVVYYDSTYRGINSITSDSIHRQFSLKIDNIVYFTTFYSVGTGYRGYLFAFDLNRKKFRTDYSSKDNYIFSGAGIFFLSKDYIYALDKPFYYHRRNSFATPADIYRINGSKFRYINTIYSKGEMAYDKSLLIEFYNKNIKNGWAKSLVLPKNARE